VYVIDGGSVDDTVRTAEQLGASVIPQRGSGYGAAIATALNCLDADHVITLDGDCSHPPALLYSMYQMRDEAEIVIASRYVRQGYASMPLMRQVLSRFLNYTFRRLLDLPVRDLSSGYRLYNRKAMQTLTFTMSTYAVLQEILIKTYCEGYRIKEIPLHYQPRAHGHSNARLWRLGRDYVATLRAMWRLRVLDAGCGSTQTLNGAPQIVGIDPQLRKLRFMRAAWRRLVNASTFALPFKSGAFDVVISSQVIEHLPEDNVIFEELVRCLAPGGALVLGTVDYGGWQWPLIEWAYGIAKPTGYADEHITHYTRRSLFERLERMGLAVEDHRYILGGEIIIKARKPA